MYRKNKTKLAINKCNENGYCEIIDMWVCMNTQN